MSSHLWPPYLAGPLVRSRRRDRTGRCLHRCKTSQRWKKNIVDLVSPKRFIAMCHCCGQPRAAVAAGIFRNRQHGLRVRTALDPGISALPGIHSHPLQRNHLRLSLRKIHPLVSTLGMVWHAIEKYTLFGIAHGCHRCWPLLFGPCWHSRPRPNPVDYILKNYGCHLC